jgi:sigma-B regulation protein RsbU (phosphoserine phosphatase)
MIQEGNHDLLQDPLALATELNGQYQIDFKTMQYFTMIYGIYDSASTRFDYLGAGHPAPILVEGSSWRELEVSGNPVGVLPPGQAVFSTFSTHLEPGQFLVFYSDGITEAFDPQREQFGTERLAESLCTAGSVQDKLAAAFAALEAWTGTTNWDDDCTLMVFTRR